MISFRNQGGGVVNAITVDPGLNRAALNGVTEFFADSRERGIPDGDVLIALGSARKDLDPAGVLLRVIGTVMNVIGPTATLALVLISIISLIVLIIEKIADFSTWFADVLGKHWPWLLFGGLGFGAGVGVGATLFDEKKCADEALSRTTGQALLAFFMGLIPRPIAGPIEVIVGNVRNTINGVQQQAAANVVSGGVANAFNVASTVAGTGPNNPLAEIAGAAAGKLWGWLNNDDGTSLDEALVGTGMNAEEVRRRLTR